MIGLAGQALLEVGSRAFYSQQKALVPLATSFITLIVFIILAVILGSRLAAPGIGLANSLAFSLEGLLLWILLNRGFPGNPEIGAHTDPRPARFLSWLP